MAKNKSNRQNSSKLTHRILQLAGALSVSGMLLGSFAVNLGVTATTIYDNTFSTVSYLGSPIDDRIAGVEIQNDDTIVLAGKIQNSNFGSTPFNLDGGGDGVVMRLSNDGKTIQSLTRISNYVDDMELDRNDNSIVINSDKGVYKLSGNGQSIVWSNNFGSGGSGIERDGNGRRVDVAQDGKVAALINKSVKIYNSNGSEINNFTIGNTGVYDIAIDSETQTVYLVGYTQKNTGGCSNLLKVPFIRAFDYQGTQKWVGYDWTNPELDSRGLCADSTIRRVEIGRDNQLYITGYTDGGNNAFSRNSTNINQNANNISIDDFTQTSNLSGAPNFSYIAQLNKSTGQQIKGQYLLARLNDGKGNSLNVEDIEVDTDGTIFVAGESQAFMPGRNQVKVNGASLGVYDDGDTFAIQISSDFTKRQRVMAVSNGGAGGKAGRIAYRNGTIMFAGRTNGSGNAQIVTINPIQGTRSGLADVFYGVINQNTAPTPGLTITQSGSSTAVTEGGATDTYTVVLNSQPTADVTVNINSGSQLSANITSLTFTPQNWNVAQTVTVTAVNDTLVEGNHSGTINHTVTSTDTNYNNLTVPGLNVAITDNDTNPAPTPGLTITQSGSSTAVTEGGATDTYTVVLNSQPTADVTVNINSGGQLSANITSLTFTPQNWNVAQTVTVTAVNDTLVEGNHSGTINHTVTSTDTNYNNLAVSLTNIQIADNDTNSVNNNTNNNTNTTTNNQALAQTGAELSAQQITGTLLISSLILFYFISTPVLKQK